MRMEEPETRLSYAVVIEPTAAGYSAFVADRPGCVATARTTGEVTRNIGSAITLHLAGMREDGEPMPLPGSRALQIA